MVIFEVHRGMSIKKTETLVKDMHWNAKKLMHQADVSRHLVRKIKGGLRTLMKKGTPNELKMKIRQELGPLLEQLEAVSIKEESEQFLVAREAEESQKRTLIDMRDNMGGELGSLLAAPAIPRVTASKVLRKAEKDIGKIRKDIGKEAKISLTVQHGSASATLQSLWIMAPSEKAAARREKRRAYKAEHEFDVIDAVKEKLKKDEASHFITKIMHDLIKESHGDRKEIHFIYINLLYSLLFMHYMEKRFKEIKGDIENGKKRSDTKEFMQKLEKILWRMQAEWYDYMKKITRVLQRLRFSIAPAEEAQVLARAA